jgi:hypothetical protein
MPPDLPREIFLLAPQRNPELSSPSLLPQVIQVLSKESDIFHASFLLWYFALVAADSIRPKPHRQFRVKIMVMGFSGESGALDTFSSLSGEYMNKAVP